jgi:signal transduction histidine kinase
MSKTDAPSTAVPELRRLRAAVTLVAVSALAVLLALAARHDTRGHLGRIEDFIAGQARGIGEAAVHLASDERAAGDRPGELEHAVTALGLNLGVRFIEIRGDRGLLVATPGASVPAAAAPEPAAPGGPPREYPAPGGSVYEVAVSGALVDGEQVVARVGLDPGPLQQLRHDAMVRARLRLGLGAAGAALIMVLLLSLQRQAVLGREVAKIRRRLERQEEEARRNEKLAAMGALAAGVAHQLRNPLNSIHLLTQVLAGDPALGEEARTRVGHITGEAARIDRRIRQFLDFARPREPVLEPVAVDEVVQGVAALQADARRQAGVEIIGYAPSRQVMIADRGFIVEILENLVRNAAEAGATKIMASLVAGGEHIDIAVADNGPGIAAAERGRVFDLYYTTRPDGSGLGLSIASQLAATLGGNIRLDDEPGLEGRGARFVLRLPHRRSSP